MEQYIECKSGELTLRGMLHMPNDASIQDKKPLVIIFHGFSADRNETFFIHTKLSRLLCEHGIASVRFDFAHSGESDGSFENMTLSTQVADGAAILDWAKTLDHVDTSRIALHGMSMGGATAAILSGRRADDLCALSLWSPALNAIDQARQKLVKGLSIANIEQDGVADVEGIEVGIGYYRDALTLDAYTDIAKFTDKPVLLVHGDEDDIVPFAISEKLKSIYGDNANLVPVHGANHFYASMDFQRQRLNASLNFFTKVFGIKN